MKEIKILLSAVCLLILGAAGFFIYENYITAYSEFGNKIIKMKLGEDVFLAEIVDNQKKIEKGLSDRESLCEKCAMLFIFDNPIRHNFWMKEMEFDLDLIWVRDDKIVQISSRISHESGAKETISPMGEVDKVIEINAGMSEKLGLKVGDEMKINK